MNYLRMKLYTALFLFGSAAASLAWTSAHAAEETPPSKVVKYADLNLQTPEGARALYNRIRAAANQVCEPVYRDPVMRDAVAPCINNAIDNAVRKVDAPYLTALRFGNGTVRLARR